MGKKGKKAKEKENRAPTWNDSMFYGDGAEQLMNWLGIGSAKEALSEVTYFTCLKKLSEAIGKMPLKYYQDTEDRGKIRPKLTNAGRLMTVRPNPYMTPATLWTTTEFNCQHYGNGYIWMQTAYRPETYGGGFEVIGMYPMAPDSVTVWMDDAGIFGGAGKLWYQYTDPKSGQSYMFRAEEVLHFKTWYSKNGITGESVRSILRDTIGGASAQQEAQNKMSEQGVTAAMVMQYSTDLDETRVKKLKAKFADQLTSPQNAGKVVPIPQGLTLQPLNMSMADSQFYELRKYSALQIAAAFGIKPNQINDYEKSSYSSSEMQQLDFLVDTLMYRIIQYEQEINSKVITPAEQEENKYYKFNDRSILRADTGSQMEALAKAVNNFIYKPNEARDYLDLSKADGGDYLIGNGNFIPVQLVGTQYGQEGGNGNDGEN